MLYQYRCPTCSVEVELLRPVAERLHLPRCDRCGVDMPQAWSLPYVQTWPPPGTLPRHRRPGGGLHMEYICRDGKTFYSRREMRDWCRRHSMQADVLE